MSFDGDAELLDEQLPAGRDGGLGELQFADIALGQVDGGVAVAAAVMQYENACSVASDGQPGGELGSDCRGFFFGNEPARAVEQPDPDELGDRVDETGTADSDRLHVADHAELDPVLPQPDDFDRALRRAHAAGDLRGFERGTGRRGRADECPRPSRARPRSSCPRR